MTKTQLAKELSISRQMVHRLIKLGMPCDSVESARRWRGSYLFGFLTKGVRIDGNTGKSREKIELSQEELINNELTDLIGDVKFRTEGNTLQLGRICRELFDFENKLLALNVTDDVRSKIKNLVTNFWNDINSPITGSQKNS